MKKEAYIIAGPNGSGKTTFAYQFLRNKKLEFVNADEIAQELMQTNIEDARIKADKLFLKRLKLLIENENNFILESTLSGTYLKNTLKELTAKNYDIYMFFIFLENEEIAISRIKERVLQGGHHVPDVDVIRRFKRSIKNFWDYYKSYSKLWFLYYNSGEGFEEVAFGKKNDYFISDSERFFLFEEKLG